MKSLTMLLAIISLNSYADTSKTEKVKEQCFKQMIEADKGYSIKYFYGCLKKNGEDKAAEEFMKERMGDL